MGQDHADGPAGQVSGVAEVDYHLARGVFLVEDRSQLVTHGTDRFFLLQVGRNDGRDQDVVDHLDKREATPDGSWDRFVQR